jgi:uncharacterized RDD family membrane protein YckC
MLEVGEQELEALSLPPVPVSVHDTGDFRIDDDLLAPSTAEAWPLPLRVAPAFDNWGCEEGLESAVAGATARPFTLEVPEADEPPGGAASVIDSDDEVPDRFWAPEGARLGRRAAAVAIDLVVLTAVLGIFYLGAFVALRASGVAAAALLSPSGLAAGLAPFGLLGLLVSGVFHVACHAGPGRTPGKQLLGLEVRSLDGGVPTTRAAAVRWFAALLGWGCAGAGVAWALFDPRRRGWADRLSRTVVADRRARPAGSPWQSRRR